MLLNNSKSYDRSFFNTWRHLCHTSISRVERHKYGIFITVAIDDPRSGKHSKIFHSRLRENINFSQKNVCRVHTEDKPALPSGHTSGTPNPCCRGGRPAIFINGCKKWVKFLWTDGKSGRKVEIFLPGEF